ncbi:MAG: hypothetical protein RL148_1343 [Planctomycetota bacterium]|jgi:hypothetical protein
MALVFALLLAIVAMGMSVSSLTLTKSHRDLTKTRFAQGSQAAEFARSGLTEAVGWFRRQTAQPVTVFNPRLDETSTPPALDTIDPQVGLVREFEISGSTWGRYEVWKEWPEDPDETRKLYRDALCCRDISQERGELTPGSVWRLRSVGYVFRRMDPTQAFDQGANHVIGKEVVEMEIRRMALQPPGRAALNARTASTCRILTRGRVLGGTTAGGVYVRAGTGNVTVSGTGASVTGGISSSASYDDSLNAVFGVNLAELQGMADAIILDPDEFPSPLVKNTLVVANTDLVFTPTAPLTGTGVLVVQGNVTIQPASNSSFSGLLYVNGNLVLREPSELQGTVVVTGSVTVQGASDFATIAFDEGVLNRLRQTIGTYRQSTATTRPNWGDQR